jgi:hypothetical protein
LSFVKTLSTNNKTLEVLDVGNSQISDIGVKNLVDMLKTNQILIGLTLERSEI